MVAAFGMRYALLPDGVRRNRWSGPLRGLLMLLRFDAVAAPALGLTEWGRPMPRARVLAVDQLLYGLVLDELRPRE
jgi:hypothetical protein